MRHMQNGAVLRRVTSAVVSLPIVGIATGAQVSTAGAKAKVMPIATLRLEYVCGGIAIFSLPAAVLLTIATRCAVKFRTLFWTAYMIQVITSVVHYFIGTVLRNALLEQTLGHRFLVGIIVWFLVSSAIYGLLIKHPETGRIGFGKGVLVSVCLLGLAFALGLVFLIPTLLVRGLR